MDFIFYGKLGQIATNNIEDQELSALLHESLNYQKSNQLL
jgi:TnpA family transposase